MNLQSFLFYATAALMAFCALRTVTSPYIFRSALYLAATLALTAVQYVLLEAEFVAIVQILVYVGAVVVLIVFAVMLTAQIGEKGISQSNKLRIPGLLLALGIGWGLIKAIQGYDWSKVGRAFPDAALKAGDSNVQSVGRTLLSGYLLPFEIVGLLLFAALVGAVLIARKDPE